jgi:SAM-dependent methyltransferase
MSWDLVAAAYADEVTPAFGHYAREALRLADVPPGSSIVDVACGPGTFALVAADAGHEVEALDFSPQMIAQLAAREQPRVRARVGDGEALPYADASFAAAVSLFGVIFFPDRAKGFAELRRVLRPGARAVVSSWPQNEVSPVIAAVLGAIGEITGQRGPIEMPPLASEDAYREEMGAAFDAIEVHRITGVQRFAAVDEVWRSFTRTFAPLVLLRPRLGERWNQLDEAGAAAVARAIGGGPPELVMTALMAVGTARQDAAIH